MADTSQGGITPISKQWNEQVDSVSAGDQPLGFAPPVENTQVYLPSVNDESLRQAEILSTITEFRLSVETLGSEETEIEPKQHALAIVLSQDCDLEQDYRARDEALSRGQELDPDSDRTLPNVLLCQLFTEEQLVAALPRGSDIKKRVIQNKDERYHFIRAVQKELDSAGQGLPRMGMDFRRYFTIPTAELYEQLKHGATRRCRMYTPMWNI